MSSLVRRMTDRAVPRPPPPSPLAQKLSKPETGEICGYVKLSAVALGIAALALSIFGSSPLFFFAGGCLALACYDIFRVADNMENLAKNLLLRALTQLSRECFKEEIGKNTLFAKPLTDHLIDNWRI